MTKIKYQVRPRVRKHQEGVVTLVTAVVLLLAVFGISFFVSETVINEKQIVSNDLRAKQAFHSAQAGIELGRALQNDTSSCSSPISNVKSSGSFVLQVCAVSTAIGLYTVQSTGFSADSAVERTLTMSVGRLPSENNPPKVPIVAKGGLGLTGNVKAINNAAPLTVWTGKEFGLNGSANTYISIDGKKNQLSSIKNPGGDNVYGPDVLTGDLNLKNALPEEILQSFFNVSAIASFATGSSPFNDSANYDVSNSAYWSQEFTYYSAVDATFAAPSNGSFDPEAFTDWEQSTGRDITSLEDEADIPSVNVNLSGSDQYLGTPSNPVKIVVDGTLTINGSPTIFGVIIADKIRVTGSPVIFGGVVVLSKDDDAVDGAGSPTIIMDSTVIDDAFNEDGYGPVKSSWKDW